MGISVKKTNKTQASYAAFLIQGKTTNALVDIGSSTFFIICSYLQPLDFKGTIEDFKGKILTAKNSSMPVKGKVEGNA